MRFWPESAVSRQKSKRKAGDGKCVCFHHLIGCVLWGVKRADVFIFLQQSDGSRWGLQTTHISTILLQSIWIPHRAHSPHSAEEKLVNLLIINWSITVCNTNPEIHIHCCTQMCVFTALLADSFFPCWECPSYNQTFFSLFKCLLKCSNYCCKNVVVVKYGI